MEINKYLIPTLLLGLAIPAGAQSFGISRLDNGDGSLRGRDAKGGLTFTAQKKVKSNNKKRTIGYVGDNIQEIDKLGELRLVFEEDFSLMTAGSIESPATDVDMAIPMDDPAYKYPWWNMKPEFTHEPNWGTGAEDPGVACPAGGCYYMEMAEVQGPMGQVGSTQAKINTPLIKVDEDGGICVLEFRARTRNAGETYDYLLVEVAETYNMSPTWRTIDDEIMVGGIPSEWTTVRLVFRAGGPTTLFHLVGVGPGNVYIDDLKVYQLVPKVMYPEATAYTDYKGTSFTANWLPVEGVDSYLLNVYSYDAQGNKKMLVQDQKVDGTSYNVTGAVSGDIYWYTVRAVKGEDVSIESFPARVYALEAPVMNSDVKWIDNRHYKASWSKVPGGDVYNYMAFAKRVATEDGPFVVTFEDFTGITDMDGNRTGLTKEEPDPHSISGQFYPTELNQQGWYGESAMPYDDYIAFDSFHYEASGHRDRAGFFSPDLDLSKDGGKFEFEADLAAETDDAGNTTKGAVGLFNWDENAGDYVEAEIVNFEDLDLDWSKCKHTFTKGSERSQIAIFSYGSYGNLYLDNLKITQNYKKGESFMDPFCYVRWNGRFEDQVPNEVEIEVPARAFNLDLYHQASAYGRLVDERNQVYDDRESPMASLTFIGMTDSVKEIEASPVDAATEYFTIDGIRINNADLTPGLYIVRRGSDVTKQLIK